MNAARIRVLLLACGDMVCLGAVWMLCAVGCHVLRGGAEIGAYARIWPMLLIFVFCNALIRLYHGNFFYPGAALPPVEELRRMCFSITLTFLVLLAYLTLTHRSQEYAREVVVMSWAVCCLVMLPFRDWVRFLMFRLGIGQIPVLIAGAGRTGRQLAAELAQSPHFGLRVVGFLDDNPESGADGEPPVLGSLQNAGALGRQYHADYLIFCLPVALVQRYMRDYMRDFSHLAIVADNQVFPISWAYPVDWQGLAGVELRNQLLLPGPRMLKRILEFLLALAGVVMLWPLMLILALLVKCSGPGPVFYRARRLGQGGRPIRVWKFRTMRQNADDELEKMLEENPNLAGEWREKVKLENDPRVTKIGLYLRRSSLDEMPQLFNVLCGEMAMIGPRPIVEPEVTHYGENYELFSRVKPGITGLWQVSGRSDISYEKRVRLDMYYILNWSIWLDVHILSRTVLEVIRCRGAR